MLKKVISVVCITLLLFSVLSVGFASSTIADDMPLTGRAGCAGGCVGYSACVVYVLVCGAFSINLNILSVY